MNAPAKIETTLKDWETDQEVRWCPGCGDYAILKAVQRTLPQLGADPAKTVFISGIGCSSRFPYYMESYGFHTIHGRAPAVATGVKLANPELDIWLVTGDGDGLSIGGNHLMHVLRRNVNMQIMLFNNEIYGLTKGQASPTSREGTRSPSSPLGSVDHPAEPAAFALGAGARFVGRGFDVSKHLPDVLKAAHAHQGAAFIEIFQNCIVYNDEVFAEFTAKDVAADAEIILEHGKPLIFGKEKTLGLRVKPGFFELEVVTIGKKGISETDILAHDETNRALASMLALMEPPSMPVAIGVLYCHPTSSYEDGVKDHFEEAEKDADGTDLNALLRRGHTWTIK